MSFAARHEDFVQLVEIRDASLAFFFEPFFVLAGFGGFFDCVVVGAPAGEEIPEGLYS